LLVLEYRDRNGKYNICCNTKQLFSVTFAPGCEVINNQAVLVQNLIKKRRLIATVCHVAAAACRSAEADETADIGRQEEATRSAVSQQGQSALLRQRRLERSALSEISKTCVSVYCAMGSASLWV